jgi:hypothetical protein
MILTEKEIEFGFWNKYSRKPKYLNFDNPKVFKVRELGLAIPEESRSLNIKAWNSVIPKLTQVEYLWTYHKVSQETFDKFVNCNFKGINFVWLTFKTKLQKPRKYINMELFKID